MGAFDRTELLIGIDAMARLRALHVMVVGIGAVGGMATEVLARAGVGRITIVDFDRVEESNINRQIVALHSTVGKLKVDVMHDRILDINPDCEILSLAIKVDSDNVSKLLDNISPNIVVDAIDDVRAKVSLLTACVDQNIMVVSSMGAAQKRDLSRIKVGSMNQTSGCSLAKAVRHGLKERSVDLSKIIAVYSDECIAPDVAAARDSARVLPSMMTMTAGIGVRAASVVINDVIDNFD